MNIKNQIRLSVIISLFLAVVISASIVVSYQHMQDLQQQEVLAADVVKGSYELTYLANDYIVNAEPRARVQWEKRYASLQPVINQLKPGNSEEALSIETIKNYNEKIAIVFREIPEPGTLSAGTAQVASVYQQVTWSRYNAQSQGLIYEAWSLRHLFNDDVSDARFWNIILVLALMLTMLLVIIVNYLLISRRLVRSIREVNTGSEVFATGNLDYRIPVPDKDEIGEIAEGLNKMAGDLMTVTASRDELNREIRERKRAEEAQIASEIRYRRLFEEAKDGILIIDAETGQIVDVNPFLINLLGFTREQFLGTKIWEIGLFRDIIANKDNFLELQRKEFIRYEDLPLETADGQRIDVEFISNVYLVNNTKVIQCNIRDITNRKLMESEIRSLNTVLEQRVKQRTAQLNTSLEDKVILLREVHHRVKNNLQIIISLLNLQSRYIEDEKTRQVIRESQNRVRAMALVHEKLYQSTDIEKVDLESYIRFLGNNLFQFYGMSGKGIVINTRILDIHTGLDTAITVGLIVNELVSNSLKHAFPDGRKGEIFISIQRENSIITIEYNDNGIGIPQDFDWRNAESLGLRLVIMLVEQLDGTIELDRSSGTAFTIVVKDKE